MAKVVNLLADGFEELEAVAIIDVLRRAEIEIVSAGLHEGTVSSARNVNIIPDTSIDAISADDFEMLVLPGGIPGSDNLNADERVRKLIQDFNTKGKITGAICAAPYVLANAGILDGKRATSYPTFKDRLGSAVYEEKTVVEDGNVLTSRGPGTALCFGLAIVERLAGKERLNRLRKPCLSGIPAIKPFLVFNKLTDMIPLKFIRDPGFMRQHSRTAIFYPSGKSLADQAAVICHR
jgi:4-methyl-5(b-hydroxyethyl)-thiazole monophosphate biosynthesis